MTIAVVAEKPSVARDIAKVHARPQVEAGVLNLDKHGKSRAHTLHSGHFEANLGIAKRHTTFRRQTTRSEKF